jgi:hypothetical protein
VKLGWDLLQGKKQRDTYLWICLIAGMLGVFVWVGAYACVYPTLSKGVDEHIAALTVFDNQGTGGASNGLNFAGAKWIDVITVSGQAIAEIFLSAVMGMYLTGLYARHRPVRLAQDPAFVQLSEEREELEAKIARERLGLGEATGHLVRLENELSALIAYGKSMFLRESARRQDQSQKKQVILDHLSDHLRSHIETSNAGRLGVGAEPAVSLKNGG